MMEIVETWWPEYLVFCLVMAFIHPLEYYLVWGRWKDLDKMNDEFARDFILSFLFAPLTLLILVIASPSNLCKAAWNWLLKRPSGTYSIMVGGRAISGGPERVCELARRVLPDEDVEVFDHKWKKVDVDILLQNIE